MSLYRTDTLAYHKSRPLFQNRDLSKISVAAVVKNLNMYMVNPTQVSPETEALRFYLMNHAFSELQKRFDPHEILAPNVEGLADRYVRSSSDSAVRMLFYMLMIITRECRHWKNHSATQAKIVAPYSETFKGFQSGIPGGSMEAVKYLRSNAPDIPMGEYVSAITDIFNKGSFQSQFGGKPWGVIADTLRKYVHGEISAEILMDTAWTLAHNNGPMFNKGMLYQQYSDRLYMILDVQRAGMIPQLINQVVNHEVSMPDPIVGNTAVEWKEAKDILGSCFEGYVDWIKVRELGAKHSYASYEAAQIAKHGSSGSLKGEKFFISPIEFVMVVKREEVEA